MPRLRFLLSRAAAALVVVVATTALTHAMLRLLRPDVFRGDEGPLTWLRSLVVPWIVLALPIAALVARMMRGSMAEVLDAEYLRTARAKGISERAVLRRHALPAAASPVATVVGIYFASFASNALLVEQVFGVPGVLRLTLRAAAIGDFQLLQGLVVVTAALVVLGTFLADAAAGFLDPRVRTGGAALRLGR